MATSMGKRYGEGEEILRHVAAWDQLRDIRTRLEFARKQSSSSDDWANGFRESGQLKLDAQRVVMSLTRKGNKRTMKAKANDCVDELVPGASDICKFARDELYVGVLELLYFEEIFAITDPNTRDHRWRLVYKLREAQVHELFDCWRLLLAEADGPQHSVLPC